MGDVTRNVTIKLKVEHDAVKFDVPDISPVTRAADQISAAYSSAFSKVEQQAARVTQSMQVKPPSDPSDVYGVRASDVSPAANTPSAYKPPDTTPVKAANEKMAADARKMFRQIAKDAEQTWREVSLNARKAATDTSDYTSTAIPYIARAGESYKMAGEGAFHLARGIALLNIEGEDELAQVVKKLAYYQGVFDIFKGGVDVIRGVTVGSRNLALAYTATAATATAASGATGVFSTALAVASVAAKSLWLSLTGPVGLAVIGVTAVVTAGAYAWYKYGGAADAANAKLQKQVDHLNKVRDAQERLNVVTREGTRVALESEKGKRIREFDFTSPVSSNDDKIFKLEAERKARHERDILGLLKAADFEGKDPFLGKSANVGFRGLNPKATDFGELQSASGFATLLKNMSQADEIRKFTQGVGKKLPGIVAGPGTQADKNKELDRVALEEKQGLDARQTALELAHASAERELELRQKGLDVLDQEKGRLQGILDLEEQRYKAAQDALKVESQRNLSNAEKIGRMNPFERQQLDDISKKVEAGGVGSLQKHERDFLDKTGLAEGKISRHFINEGKAVGADDIQRRLGSGEFTPQEAAGGQGSEGDNRAAKAQRMADASLDSRADTADRLRTVAEKVDREREEFMAVLERATTMAPLIQLVKDVAARNEQDVADARADINLTKGQVKQVQQRSTRTSLGGGRQMN